MTEFATTPSTLSSIAGIVEALFCSASVFIFGTETTPYLGGEYAVFVLEVKEADLRLCVRLPRRVARLHVSHLLNREVELRQRMESANVHPFQKLIAFDTSSDNALQSSYIILEWIDGILLCWNDGFPQRDHRKKVLQDVANASLDLLKVSNGGLSLILSTPNLLELIKLGMSAWDWITSRIGRKISRATKKTIPGATLAECEMQRSMISEFWTPELDHAPHVLVHGDVSVNNIIVEENFDLQG